MNHWAWLAELVTFQRWITKLFLGQVVKIDGRIMQIKFMTLSTA